jgi:hypothetical protein
MDDPGQLQAIVTSPTAGAGAGVLTWNKTNWLLTAYAPSAPVIVADPQSQVVEAGQSATFVVVAGGSARFSYQWYFNTNTPVANATNTSLTLTNVQAANAGIYSAVASNSAGTATSLFASLTLSNALSGFEPWRTLQFTPSQLAEPLVSGPNAAPAGDGVPNFAKYALGLLPFVPATQPLIGFRMEDGEGVLSYTRPATIPDVTYRVRVSTDLSSWTETGVNQQMVGTNGMGLRIWEGTYSGPASPMRYFRLELEM